MPLTELKIKHLKSQGKPYREYDMDGLYLQVSISGGKLWRWKYRFDEKEQVLSLGKYPLVTLSQARKLRDEARLLVDAGKHPTREKKAAKLRRMSEGENTFEKICRKWLTHKSGSLNEKYAKQSLSRMAQHVFPLIGRLPITEITIPDIVRVLEKIADHGTVETARRMKQIMSQTFRYAAQRGICEHNPAADMRDVLPPTEDKHHPCVPIADLPELLQKMEVYNGEPITKAALHLLALTFVRTGELIGAKWIEVDFARAEWHIPKERMKMKRPHVVPLSKKALAIFKGLHDVTGGQIHVFHSGRSKSKHISNGAVLMALRRMGYEGRMCGHGFRTLASTLLNEKGYAPDIIERQLAHAEEDKIRAAYNRAEYLLERKKMMQDYSDVLAKMKNGSAHITQLGAKHG